MYKKNLLLIYFIAIFLPFYLKADCTLDNTTNINGITPRPAGTIYGQSFLACETGTISSILLNVSAGGTIDFYMVAGDGNGNITPASPYQTFVIGAGGMQTFNFTMPFPVTAGNLYSFALRGADVTADGTPMPAIDPTVPDGQSSFLISSGGTYAAMPAQDLYFLISNQGIPVAPIPTMNQWGLIIFGLLILNLGLFYIPRREINSKINE